MPYGEIIPMLRYGPSIRPRILRPLGVYDGSRCWALWLRDDSQLDRREYAGAEHLVISPVHPVHWAYTFRMRIELESRPGTLSRATAILLEHGVNIILNEVTPSGFRRDTWNITGDATRLHPKEGLKKKWEHFLCKDPADCDADHLETAKKMLAFLKTLKADLIAKSREDRDSGGQFLHNRTVDSGGYLYSFPRNSPKPETTLGERYYRQNQGLLADAVSIRIPSDLMYLSRCAMRQQRESSPVELRYRAALNRFESPTTRTWWFIDREGLRADSESYYPGWACMGINKGSAYIRIQPLSEEEADSVRCFRVEYSILRPTDDTVSPRKVAGGATVGKKDKTRLIDPNEEGNADKRAAQGATRGDSYYSNESETNYRSSKGLLHAVTESIHNSNHDINILRSSNSIAESSEDIEHGQIEIYALPFFAEKQALAVVRSIESAVDEFSVASRKVTQVPLYPIRIFMSLNQSGFPRWKAFERLIADAAEEAGLRRDSLHYCWTQTEDVTQTVSEDIARCDGMLQFIIEKHTAWHVAEYALALAGKKPRVRVFGYYDEHSKQQEIADSRLERDHFVSIIDLKQSDEDIRRVFRDALDALVKKISDQRQGARTL